jgi:hypothetical protein
MFGFQSLKIFTISEVRQKDSASSKHTLLLSQTLPKSKKKLKNTHTLSDSHHNGSETLDSTSK